MRRKSHRLYPIRRQWKPVSCPRQREEREWVPGDGPVGSESDASLRPVCTRKSMSLRPWSYSFSPLLLITGYREGESCKNMTCEHHVCSIVIFPIMSKTNPQPPFLRDSFESGKGFESRIPNSSHHRHEDLMLFFSTLVQ